jgi:AraC family transcriptional regulator
MSGYGDQIGEHFRLRQPKSLISRGLNHANFAVTELRCDTPDHGLTIPVPPEDAFIVGLQLSNYSGDLWLDGISMNVGPISKGKIAIYDLGVPVQAYLRTPFHCLQFYFPADGLKHVVDGHGGNINRDLSCALGATLDDPVWMQATQLLMPALQAPDQTNQLFLDHVFLALAAHFVARYCGVTFDESPARGGLAPWQLRVSEDLILNRLDGKVSLAEMATACGLTSSYFARAFKCSTGLPPHRWLLKKRIEKSQNLMLHTNLTLLEIALTCGFTDQSHFTRVFVRHCALNPSSWRRAKYSTRQQH